MAAEQNGIIRTPTSVRVRRLLQGWPLQALTFLVLVSLVVLLWKRQDRSPNSVGQVEAVRVNVTAGSTGKLLPMYELSEGQWKVFDRVFKGQVVARLDDTELQSELALLRGQAERLRADLAAVQFEFDSDQSRIEAQHFEAAAELAREVESHRLEILDRLAELEQIRLTAQQLGFQVELAERAFNNGVVGRSEFQDLKSRHQAQLKLEQSHSASYRQAQENHQAALRRVEKHPAMFAASVVSRIEPLRKAVSAAESRAELLQAQIAGLEIRSPVSGTIVAVHTYPGQGLRAGAMIVTIASEEADHIVAYVRSDQQIRPAAGAKVAVRLRLPSSNLVSTVARQIGTQWEPLPPELRRDPNLPEMALPIKIAIPPELNVKPGELVDVTFLSEEGGI